MSDADRIQLRAAVADALKARGHGNPEFLRQVRDGEQDDGPYMVGAIAGFLLRAPVQAEAAR